MRRAVISLANDRGNYYKGLCRLGESLRGNFSGDFLGFMGEASVGAPPHNEVPYGFKVKALNRARDLGYDSVMWLDSSVFAIKPINHLFDIIEQDGHLMQEAGCFVGQWCNDFTLNYAKLSRQDAMSIPCYGNAGMLGLNLCNNLSMAFLNEWALMMRAGCFNGSWTDHRHDLTCGSIIANRLGWKFQPGDQILQYAAPGTTPQNETICLMAQGM